MQVSPHPGLEGLGRDREAASEEAQSFIREEQKRTKLLEDQIAAPKKAKEREEALKRDQEERAREGEERRRNKESAEKPEAKAFAYFLTRSALQGRDELTEEELGAIREGDIGLLYVMGVNGQILMHYSALIGQEWDEYIHAMKEGVKSHGPVRAGMYTLLKDSEL